MGTSAKRPAEEAGTWTADHPTPSAQYLTGTGSSSGLETIPAKPRAEIRVRYGETEAALIARRSQPITDIRPYGVGARDEQIDARISKCLDLLDKMLETEDVIERENTYRTLDEYLGILFELRSYREREFGQLLVTILGVTKHTSSEFFSNDHLSALKRAIKLIGKPRIASPDLRDARRLLSGAGFDVFRPIRGVFEDV